MPFKVIIMLMRLLRFPKSSSTSHSTPALLATVAMAMVLSGCTADSWFDPSVVGRWESTPAIAPIIDRIDVIEPAEKDFVQATSVTSSDLIPDIKAYTIGEADSLLIDIFALIDPGIPYVFQRVVNDTGFISIPQIGQVYVAGYTETEVQRIIADRLQPDILLDPLVSVIAQNKVQNRFSISGPRGAGLIDIPHPRFHLTDALAAYGSTPDSADYIYVIRQIPLDEVVIRGASRRPPVTPNLFDDDASDSASTSDEQEALDDLSPDVDLGELIDALTEPDENADLGRSTNANQDDQSDSEPAIQIPAPGEGGSGGGLGLDDAHAKWVYLDGNWVRVAIDPAQSKSIDQNASDDDLISGQDISKLVTQRVIRIPVKPLLEGVAAYNIIIRQNDIIRVPSPEVGLVYLQGEISRPGSFDLPITGRQTLIRAIAGAGGLAPLAIPERVDIIRLLPNNRQASVRVNLRAIMEMTEPDIYLKPGDVINIGTSWYAAPLAVIRNGFRTSYGFGFLLDRNFGNDVFGAPPSNSD